MTIGVVTFLMAIICFFCSVISLYMKIPAKRESDVKRGAAS